MKLLGANTLKRAFDAASNNGTKLLGIKDIYNTINKTGNMLPENGVVFWVNPDINMNDISDSMMLDSNQIIASMLTENDIMIYLEVKGEVRVTFEGETYRSYSEFPPELKDLIANDRQWELDDRVYVGNNNWFEAFVSGSALEDAGIAEESDVVDIENCSYGSLFNVCKDIADRYTELIKEQGKDL